MNFSQISGVLGTIALAIGGYLISFGNHKILSIWMLFGGIILLMLCAVLQYLKIATRKKKSIWIFAGIGLFALFALIGALYLHVEALQTPKATTPKPSTEQVKAESIHNNTITSNNQTLGFTGINTGTLNLKDPKDDARLKGLESESAIRADKAKAEEEAKVKKEADERPTTLFQNGKPVGRASSFTLDEPNGVARFSKITKSNDLVIEQPFEYRAVVLKLLHADVTALRSFNADGTDDGKTLSGVTCTIVGRAQ